MKELEEEIDTVGLPEQMLKVVTMTKSRYE